MRHRHKVCLAAVLWLSCGCLAALLRLPCGCLVAALRLSCGCLVAVLWLSCGCLVAVLRLSCGCLAAVLWLSCCSKGCANIAAKVDMSRIKVVCDDTTVVRLHGFVKGSCSRPTKPSNFFFKIVFIRKPRMAAALVM